MTQKEKAPFCCHRNGAAPVNAHHTHTSSIPRIATKCARTFLHIIGICLCMLAAYFFVDALFHAAVYGIIFTGETIESLLGGIMQ